ncbi:MAG: prephenate dehydrogenase [Pyrinomonadaceae bacterium]|nr:prephenate dehydrogenase [Pyrinomonadaceae bacterium]
MRIAIFGIGLIGGSLAKSLRESNFASEIIGVENSQAHAEKALELGLVDRVESKENAIAEADLIILTVPVNALIDELKYVLERIKPHQIVTDCGSTKGVIIDGVRNAANRNRYVASHPMAGTEYSGPTAAISGLFNGKICIFCDVENSDSDAVETVEKMYRAIGMDIKQMESHQHDIHAAYISHISHISSFVLAATVLEKEKDEEAIFEMAGGGFESTVRLAKSSPNTWSPIFQQNKAYLLEAIDTYIEKMYHFRNLINKNKFAELEKFMSEANEIKKILK